MRLVWGRVASAGSARNLPPTGMVQWRIRLPEDEQGYDRRLAEVRCFAAGRPLTLQPGDALVSTISVKNVGDQFKWCPADVAAGRGRTAAVPCLRKSHHPRTLFGRPTSARRRSVHRRGGPRDRLGLLRPETTPDVSLRAIPGAHLAGPSHK